MANVYYLDKLYNIAKLHGDKTVNFKVDNANDDYDAVNLATLKKKLENVGGSGSSGGVSNCNECSDTFAKLHGDSSNTFKVDNANDDYDAVNLATLKKKLENVGGSGSSGGVSNCNECSDTFALKNGDKTVNFKVAKPSDDYDAVNKNYVNSAISNYKHGYIWANTDSKDFYMTPSESDVYRLDNLYCSALIDGLYLISYTISAKIQIKNANSGDIINNSFGVYRESKELSFSFVKPFHVKLSSGASTYYYSASMSFLADLYANNKIQVYLYYDTNNPKISTKFYYGRRYVADSSLVAVRVGPRYKQDS